LRDYGLVEAVSSQERYVSFLKIQTSDFADAAQISSHPLIPLPMDQSFVPCTVPTIPRSHPLQYRMDDNSIKTFAKGTGEGYL
jgi:hypothetical protein